MAQEGRKVKPILPTTPSHSTDRKTSRTNLTSLKPAEDFFFFPFLLHPEFLLPFCPSFFFYSFFLPSFTLLFLPPAFFYLFILIFVKIPSYLASDLSLFLLPSVLPFLFYSLFVSFPSPFLFFFLLFPHVRIKPRMLKRPELDPVRPIHVSSRPVSTGD